MNIMDKLAEDAIGIILAGSDDWIDDGKHHNFESDYDWVNDGDTCMLYFRVDGKRIGSWDIDIAEIEDIMALDEISSEVEAAVSGMNAGKESDKESKELSDGSNCKLEEGIDSNSDSYRRIEYIRDVIDEAEKALDSGNASDDLKSAISEVYKAVDKIIQFI